jgi:hypothetical protein
MNASKIIDLNCSQQKVCPKKQCTRKTCKVSTITVFFTVVYTVVSKNTSQQESALAFSPDSSLYTSYVILPFVSKGSCQPLASTWFKNVTFNPNTRKYRINNYSTAHHRSKNVHKHFCITETTTSKQHKQTQKRKSSNEACDASSSKVSVDSTKVAGVIIATVNLLDSHLQYRAAQARG